MLTTKRYNPNLIEPELVDRWSSGRTYEFNIESQAPVFSIDTPPPTVSGKLHLGHIYSYSHADFIARFWRMNGYNVFYPMGFDDNGLPTGRLVEKQVGMNAKEMGRDAFIENCLRIIEEAEREYKEIWQRLGLSIDWRYTYRTIDDPIRRISQLSFVDLYRQGRVYGKESPSIWCPECSTAIAQAELDDIQRQSEFLTLRFKLLPQGERNTAGKSLLIATTRPELLPACVAIFVHPDDERYNHLVGHTAEVPIFEQQVPILMDPLADPLKGTGIVMCCTFGDQTDITWWHQHDLPLIEAIDTSGRMTARAGLLAGLTVGNARKRIKDILIANGYLENHTPVTQSIRVHERCDTPVEFISNFQWFIRVLDRKDDLLKAGDAVRWYPAHMGKRYQAWVENLSWDWCISRQRYFGVPFPIWYCSKCGEIIVAEENQLPVDPSIDLPRTPCPKCGCESFKPETDVMDTWGTSSLTPQLAGGWLDNPKLYELVFPFSVRPQAHEIIRTWAFYTIVKSKFHFDRIPWRDAFISGWGIAGEGEGKISKSRGGGPMPPIEMMEKYSADAIRYWAASTGAGKDAVISEEKIQIGSKLVNKIWNVARFSSRFIEGYTPDKSGGHPELSPADRWVLSQTQELIQRATSYFKNYDYAAAKAETETFFWTFADNYLEMAKQRLYDRDSPLREGARYSLYHVLLTLMKLFAPILPYITEHIYQGIYIDSRKTKSTSMVTSIHTSEWPVPDERFIDEEASNTGELLLEIARLVRRYKSEHNLPLGTALTGVKLAVGNLDIVSRLEASIPDLRSITRVVDFQIDGNINKSTIITSSNWDFNLEIIP
jgi:valyl-tRNA synthetase